MKKEIWKDISDYEGLYQVSNLGRVKSLPRQVKNRNGYYLTKERILKPILGNHGYYSVNLSKKSITKTLQIHKLVAIAFLNHVPCGHRLVVDHKNDIKTDNRLENLQIITQRENACKTQKNYSSNYKGVYWNKQSNKWHAQIVINGKQNYLGLFTCELEASNVYQNKLKTL